MMGQWRQHNRSRDEREDEIAQSYDEKAVASGDERTKHLKLKKSPTKYVHPEHKPRFRHNSRGRYDTLYADENAPSQTHSKVRSLLSDDPKLSDHKHRKSGPPVCVCGASAFFEREKIQLARSRKQVKAEAEEVERSIRELKAKEEAISQQDTQFHKRQLALDLHEEKLRRSDEKLEAKSRDLEKRMEELQEYENELKAAEGQLEEYHHELETKNQKIASRIAWYHKKKTELETRESNLGDREEQLQTQEDNLQAARREIDEKTMKLEDVEAELNDREQNLLDKAEKLTAREADCKEMEKSIAGLKDSLQTRICALETEEQEYKKLTAELKEKEARADKIIKEEKQIMENLARHEKEMQVKLDRKARMLEQKENELQLREEDMKSSLKMRQEWIETQTAQLEKLEHDLQEEQKLHREQWEKTRSELMQGIEDEHKQLREAHDQVQRKEKELNNAYLELEKRERDLLAEANAAERLKTTEKKLTARQEELASRERELKRKIEEHEDDAAKLRELIRKERESLDQRNEDLQTNESALMDKWREFQDEQQKRKEAWMVDAERKRKELQELELKLDHEQEDFMNSRRIWNDRQRQIESEIEGRRLKLEAQERKLAEANEELKTKEAQLADALHEVSKRREELAEREKTLDWELQINKHKPGSTSRDPSPVRKRSLSYKRGLLNGQNSLPAVTTVLPSKVPSSNELSSKAPTELPSNDLRSNETFKSAEPPRAPEHHREARESREPVTEIQQKPTSRSQHLESWRSSAAVSKQEVNRMSLQESLQSNTSNEQSLFRGELESRAQSTEEFVCITQDLSTKKPLIARTHSQDSANNVRGHRRINSLTKSFSSRGMRESIESKFNTQVMQHQKENEERRMGEIERRRSIESEERERTHREQVEKEQAELAEMQARTKERRDSLISAASLPRPPSISIREQTASCSDSGDGLSGDELKLNDLPSIPLEHNIEPYYHRTMKYDPQSTVTTMSGHTSAGHTLAGFPTVPNSAAIQERILHNQTSDFHDCSES